MRREKQYKIACLMACLLLAACGSKKAGMELYQLPSSRAVQIDNDSYYIQPNAYQPGSGSYHGCAQIGDAPSCGGG